MYLYAYIYIYKYTYIYIQLCEYRLGMFIFLSEIKRPSVVCCWLVCHDRDPCKNSWPNRNAIGATWRIRLNCPCPVAMQPFCQITLITCLLIRWNNAYNRKMLQLRLKVGHCSKLNTHSQTSSMQINLSCTMPTQQMLCANFAMQCQLIAGLLASGILNHYLSYTTIPTRNAYFILLCTR